MDPVYESKCCLKRFIDLEDVSKITKNLEDKLCDEFVIKNAGANKYLLYSASFSHNNGNKDAEISLKILDVSKLSESPCLYNSLSNNLTNCPSKQISIESYAKLYSSEQLKKWQDIFGKFIGIVDESLEKESH